MQDERARLTDIVACADEIVACLDNVGPSQFDTDRIRQRAVERLLMIIGEAAKQLPAATRARIDQPWDAITRLRDKGVQHYDSLTPAITYRIATVSVPELRDAVQTFLSQAG